MLSTNHRLRAAADFRHTVRRGRRSGGRLLTLHLASRDVDKEVNQQVVVFPRVGFVVSKAVGPAVVRNRVKRRLRHLMRARIGALEPGTLVVVRAHPAAATASFAELGAELDRRLERCLTRVDTP